MPPRESERDQRRKIAQETIAAVNAQRIASRYSQHVVDLKPTLEYLSRHTKFYLPNHPVFTYFDRPKASPSPYGHGSGPMVRVDRDTRVNIELQKRTTLEAVEYFHAVVDVGQDGRRVGVLNFASATKPGGGWRNGADAQEESLARSSTLWTSLESRTVASVYQYHLQTDAERGQLGGTPFKGWYSHTCIWSPRVVVFRDDKGGWHRPFEVDVVTCAAVNAKEVRRNSRPDGPGPYWQRHVNFSSPPPLAPGATYVPLDHWILTVMRERMTCILLLFEHKGVADLVLGSFGTGVFQNDVEAVASIWRYLLYDKHARFKHSFTNVIFALPDQRTFDVYQRVFSRQSSSHTPQWNWKPNSTPVSAPPKPLHGILKKGRKFDVHRWW